MNYKYRNGEKVVFSVTEGEGGNYQMSLHEGATPEDILVVFTMMWNELAAMRRGNVIALPDNPANIPMSSQ